MGQPERQKDAVENAVVLGVCALWTPLTVNLFFFFLERLQWGCVSWSQGATVLVRGAGLGDGWEREGFTQSFSMTIEIIMYTKNCRLWWLMITCESGSAFNYLELTTCRIFPPYHLIIGSDVWDLGRQLHLLKVDLLFVEIRGIYVCLGSQDWWRGQTRQKNVGFSQFSAPCQH